MSKVSKKGFTLIELLGVITILAILSLLASIPVTKFIKDANEKACKDQVNTIIMAAKLWGNDHFDLLPDIIDGTSTVTLDTLIKDGYLKETPKNPKTKHALDTTLQISITKKGKKYFEYKLVNNFCN